jgi:hypothetical protein
MMGDKAFHATSACDYRRNKEMRLAATVYIADVNDQNYESILDHYTQAYPPNDDVDLLLSWKGRHWKKDDPSRKLPTPSPDHILLQNPEVAEKGKKYFTKIVKEQWEAEDEDGSTEDNEEL